MKAPNASHFSWGLLTLHPACSCHDHSASHLHLWCSAFPYPCPQSIVLRAKKEQQNKAVETLSGGTYLHLPATPSSPDSQVLLLLYAFVALPVWNKYALSVCGVWLLSELGYLTECLWSQTALRAEHHAKLRKTRSGRR